MLHFFDHFNYRRIMGWPWKSLVFLAISVAVTFAAFSAESQAQQTVVYSMGFEPGNSSTWSVLVRDWGCPCPAATFNFRATSAARTGRSGVLINITSPSKIDWHVQLQSPLFNLSTTQIYTACVWVRTNIANGANIPMNLIARSGYEWATGTTIRATADWRQVCIPYTTPASSAEYYYTLDVGLLTGSIFADDFTLVAQRNTAEDDAVYCNSTNVAARINTIRKGNFSLLFLNRTTGMAMNGIRLTSLKLRLAMHDFPFGSAMEWSNVAKSRLSWYLDTAKKHFNALVPEWSFEWPSYEPTRGQYNSSYNYLISKHIDFAYVNDFVLSRGHTLEWLASYPEFAQHWSRQSGCDNYRTYLQERITRDVSAFRGRFQQYDVFSEILHELHFVGNCSGMWPGILYDGFRWAAAADPTAQLCLNDYDLITSDDWYQMVQLVKDMKAVGVPIHCIAVQAYVSTQDRPTPAYMKPRLDALAALNLSILITEYNFFSYWDGGKPVWNGTEAEQAKLHEEYVRFWFSVPYIKAIILWGFWDTNIWVQNGGIYYPNTTAKASAKTLSTLWGTTWNTTFNVSNIGLPATGMFGPYIGFYGKYYYEATIGSKVYSGYVRFPASGGARQTAKVPL